jgi:isopenicillin-N N-acyltransferase-like protein
MNSNDLHIVELSGTPRERGRIHGESLGPVIRQGVSQWQEHISQLLDLDFDVFLDGFLERSNYLPAIENASPSLLEEVRGIGEGSGIAFRDILAWQLSFDESWNYVKELTRQEKNPLLCSALACCDQDGRPAIIAQTSDLPYYFDGAQTLLRIGYPESDFEILAFTIAGILVQNGINNRGVCYVVNTLSQLDYSYTGLPGSFFLRRVLEADSAKTAADFINKNRPAVGLNLIISDSEKLIDLECSANRVAEYSPSEGYRYLCHTNHPLVNDDRGMFESNYGYEFSDPSIDDPFPAASDHRLEELRGRLKSIHGQITVEQVKTILRSHDSPICFCRGESERGFTFGTSIFEYGPEPAFHLAPGPPGETAFRTHSFR